MAEQLKRTSIVDRKWSYMHQSVDWKKIIDDDQGCLKCAVAGNTHLRRPRPLREKDKERLLGTDHGQKEPRYTAATDFKWNTLR